MTVEELLQLAKAHAGDNEKNGNADIASQVIKTIIKKEEEFAAVSKQQAVTEQFLARCYTL